MTILVIKIISIFFGIWFTFVNLINAKDGHRVSWVNIVIMSAAWDALITCIWLI